MNCQMRFTVVATLVAPMLAIVVLAGCGSSKPEPAAFGTAPPPKPQPATLSTIKSELVNTKAQVKTTTEALNILHKSSTYDAQANYNKFTEEFLKLKAKSDAVSNRSADLKERASTYYAMWNRQVEVENPDLRRQAIQQKADAEKIYSSINNELELTRNSFQPYMSNLKDVGNYLRGNVTPANLNSISDLVSKANAQAKEVDAHAAAIIAEIDKITAATGETIAPQNPATN